MLHRELCTLVLLRKDSCSLDAEEAAAKADEITPFVRLRSEYTKSPVVSISSCKHTVFVKSLSLILSVGIYAL